MTVIVRSRLQPKAGGLSRAQNLYTRSSVGRQRHVAACQTALNTGQATEIKQLPKCSGRPTTAEFATALIAVADLTKGAATELLAELVLISQHCPGAASGRGAWCC